MLTEMKWVFVWFLSLLTFAAPLSAAVVLETEYLSIQIGDTGVVDGLLDRGNDMDHRELYGRS